MEHLAQYLNKKRVLYIHGLGSNKNSRTARSIKEYLKNCNVYAETWDLLDVENTYKAISNYCTKKGIQFVIGSSLGGFYAMSIQDSVGKILINPCMMPDVEIPKLEQIDDKTIEAFRKLRKQTESNIDAEMRASTFAGFGDNDELFNYQAHYKRLYDARNMTVVPGEHRLGQGSLYKVLEQGFGWFERFGILSESIVNEHYTNLFRGDDFSKWKDQVYDMLNNRCYKKKGGLLGVPDADALVADSDMWKIFHRGNKLMAVCCYTFKRGGRKLTACGAELDPNTGKADEECKKWLYKILADDMYRHDGWVEVDDQMEYLMNKHTGCVPIPADVAQMIMKDKKFTKIDPDGYHYWRIIGGEEHKKMLLANPEGTKLKSSFKEF